MLGIVLTAGKIPSEAQQLRPSDFYGQRAARYWAAMKQLDAGGQVIDIISVRVHVEQGDKTVSPDWLAADLAALLDGCWVSANLGFYVDLIRKKSALRSIIETSAQVMGLARAEPAELTDLVIAAERQVEVLHEHCADLDGWGFPFRAWDLSKSSMEEAQTVIWTVEPVMAAPDVVCLVGDGGVGKSKIAASISLSVAFGKPVLGHFKVPRSGKVVYLNEERPDLTRRHLHTLAASLEIDPAELPDRISLFGRGQRTWWVTDRGAQRALIRRLKKLGDVALIVFDSLHVLHDAEENDNAEMTRVIEAFRRICLEVGCCGLIIHHTGKGFGGEAATSARGASAIKDSVDSQFVVRRLKSDDPAQLQIHQDKTRRARIPSFVIRMEHDSLGDVLALNLVGKAPTKADAALPEVIALIDEAIEPLKSAEVAEKLAGKYRQEDVYEALKVVRDRNLRPWRETPRGGYIYGGKADAPA